MRKVTIYVGKVEDVVKRLDERTFDAIACDPPYGYSFVGEKWDADVPSVDLWTQVFRVMKPGAYGVAFSSTRTYHRMAVNIEDAGFEPRDMVFWLFGKGMPKGQNVSKAIDKKKGRTKDREIVGFGEKLFKRDANPDDIYGQSMKKSWAITKGASDEAKLWDGYLTTLKPNAEPAMLFMRPWEGTCEENCRKWGVGALAIEVSRVGTTGGTKGVGKQAKKSAITQRHLPEKIEHLAAGRYPSNVVADEKAGAFVDAQSGTFKSPAPGAVKDNGVGSHEIYGSGMKNPRTCPSYGDEGGASRIFYQPSPDDAEDSAGLCRFFYCGKASTKERGPENPHKTVKPVDLCRYLSRLVMPPKPGKILVPFAGVGSEVIGCLIAGWQEVVAIEMSLEYAEFAKKRIEKGLKDVEVLVVSV